MTQFDASPVLPATENDGITNPREVGAFILAQLIKLAGTYALSFAGVLSPLYLWALHSGGQSGFLAVAAGLRALWAFLMFISFLLVRALLGGVPTIVASPRREYAVTTRGGEIAAFVLAYAIVIALVLVLNAAVLGQLYMALGRMLAPIVGFGISIIFAAIAYAIFIGSRRAFLPLR